MLQKAKLEEKNIALELSKLTEKRKKLEELIAEDEKTIKEQQLIFQGFWLVLNAHYTQTVYK